jgi:hypothetical protein
MGSKGTGHTGAPAIRDGDVSSAAHRKLFIAPVFMTTEGTDSI